MNTSRNPVGWFEIYVQDMERAKAFYQATFQMKLEPLESPDAALAMWMFPSENMSEAPGCTGALVKMEGKDSGVGGTIIYFSCADCAIEAQRARESGGKVLKEKVSIEPYGFMALVHDPEGNLIGLHSME